MRFQSAETLAVAKIGILEGTTARVEERCQGRHIELQARVVVKTSGEIVAVVERGKGVIRALAGNADHEEQVKLAASVSQRTADRGLDDGIGISEFGIPRPQHFVWELDRELQAEGGC